MNIEESEILGTKNG